MGTLCRISFARRNPDSTLTLVVQGLTRGVVLRGTQTLPYSRGDVQLLPDAEALLEGARAAARYLQSLAEGDVAADGAVSAAVRMRLTAAAAAREAEAHFEYEAVSLSVDAGGNLAPLNQLNATAATSLSQVEAAVDEALRQAPMLPSDSLDSLYNGSRAADDLRAAVEATEEMGAAEAAEEAEALLALEVQVWLELDDLLQVAHSVPPAACRLPPAACRLPPATCRLPPCALPSDPSLTAMCTLLAAAGAAAPLQRPG